MAPSQGAELALLLLGGFHSMTDEVIAALAERGHPGVRAVHEFALRAIDTGADTASELGRRLSVSKQAAAKTIAALQALGYVEIEPDPADGRRRRICVTPRGRDMVAVGSALFDDVRERWAAQIGAEHLDALQAHLGRLVTPRPLGAEDLARVADADADAGRPTSWTRKVAAATASRQRAGAGVQLDRTLPP